MQSPPIRDTRTATRWFAAILLPLGPAAVAVLRFVLPYSTLDSAAVATAKIAAHPGAEELALWLTVVAALTLVPGVFAALRMTSRRAPVVSALAGLFLVPAYLCLLAVGIQDDAGYTVHHSGITVQTATAVMAAAVAQPWTSLESNVFVLGHIVGSILLAVAFYRARRFGIVPAVLLAVSQPIHLVAALSGNHPLDLIGWGLTSAMLGVAGFHLVRMSNDDWDRAPEAAPADVRRVSRTPERAAVG